MSANHCREIRDGKAEVGIKEMGKKPGEYPNKQENSSSDQKKKAVFFLSTHLWKDKDQS
jgi:hypothetical protein